MRHLDSPTIRPPRWSGIIPETCGPGEGMILCSRCSGSWLRSAAAPVSRTWPFDRDRACRSGLPSSLPPRSLVGLTHELTLSRSGVDRPERAVEAPNWPTAPLAPPLWTCPNGDE
jgi:hypothetical protein